MGKPRKPARKETPPDKGKAARREANPERFFGERFRLSLLRIDFDGPFGWRAASADHYVKVLQRLQQLEALTWRDILDLGRHWNHAIAVDKLSPDAQKRLLLIKLDPDELLSLRVEGALRVWGIRDGAVLHLLWYDPEHQVYPMNIAKN